MPRILISKALFVIILFIVNFQLSIIDSVSAQNPISTVSAQTNSFEDFITNLLGGLEKKQIDTDLCNVNKSHLPAGVDIRSTCGGEEATPPSQVQGITNSDILTRTAAGYKLAGDSGQPQKTDSATSNIFEQFVSFITSHIFQIGNQSAGEFAGERLPPGVAEKQLSQSNVLTQIGTGDSNVLAAQSDQSLAMMNGIAVARKTELPFLAGQMYIESYQLDTPTPIPSAIPTEAPVSVPPPLPTIPPVSDCSGPAFTDSSIGKCEIKTAGPCSWCEMRRFFPDDVSAKKASQICFLESAGGNVFAVNGSCLTPVPPRTREYSVGLFQINLWFDNRCPGAVTIRDSATNWCREGPNFAECTRTFHNRDYNIQYAVRMSGGGKKWQPWSTASPLYCDIKDI